MKNILLIAPKYFGYEDVIRQKIEDKGYGVDLIYENIKEISFFYRYLAKIFFTHKDLIFRYYYNKKICKRTYEIVLVIRGSSLTKNTICDIKKNSPNAYFCLYQWDSVKNNTTALKIARFFDSVYTFDPCDAKKYGWIYRPLFYISRTEQMTNRKYDLAYICSLHSDRVKIFNFLKKEFKDRKVFYYLFSNRLHYFKQKYICRNLNFQDIDDSEIKFFPLSLKKTNEIMSQSKIIVDYTHPNQDGFTMRTIECIGHKCKLITNNSKIKTADFYNSNNVYIYDINNIEIPLSFINSKYCELQKEIYDRYTIDSWIEVLLSNE